MTAQERIFNFPAEYVLNGVKIKFNLFKDDHEISFLVDLHQPDEEGTWRWVQYEQEITGYLREHVLDWMRGNKKTIEEVTHGKD